MKKSKAKVVAPAPRKTKKKKTATAKKTKTKRTFGEMTPQQKKIVQVNQEARMVIYNAGKAGDPLPSWKSAIKEGAKKVFK